MKKKTIFLLVLMLFKIIICEAQNFIKTVDLFPNQKADTKSGSLNIIQDPRIDTLLSRYILSKRKLVTTEGTHGIEGFRIQIHSNSNRKAREESGKVRAEFISIFPDIPSYQSFDPPVYFKIRVGDFRSKTEGIKFLLLIQKKFPDAYFVPCMINFPDLNNN